MKKIILLGTVLVASTTFMAHTLISDVIADASKMDRKKAKLLAQK